MFGVRPHQDDIWFMRSTTAVPKRHWYCITLSEGTLMLDIPNIAMIVCDNVLAFYSEESYDYADSFSRMEKVVCGAAGS